MTGNQPQELAEFLDDQVGGALAEAPGNLAVHLVRPVRACAPEPQAADNPTLQWRQRGEGRHRLAARMPIGRGHFVRISLPCRVMRKR